VVSSARFEGSLNVDLNEITMNLVPFPRMHYLVSSQAPLYSLADIKIPARRLIDPPGDLLVIIIIVIIIL